VKIVVFYIGYNSNAILWSNIIIIRFTRIYFPMGIKFFNGQFKNNA
jgi:hypothetical protein